MARLDNKNALITGAARGIGKAIAQRYIAEGAKVAIADVNLQAAQATAQELGANAIAVKMDVTKQASIDAAIAEVEQQLGSVDILVNNAGLFDASVTIDIERDKFDSLYAVNVAGVLFTMQAVAKSMIKYGKGGKIINMASQAGRRGEALVAVYCSTKAAVISLTQSVGLDLIKHGINVNAISPGVVDGEHWQHVDEMFAKLEDRPIGEKYKIVGEAVPFGRMGTPQDLTGMAVFLASDDAEYIVAQTYNVDGGNWLN